MKVTIAHLCRVVAIFMMMAACYRWLGEPTMETFWRNWAIAMALCHLAGMLDPMDIWSRRLRQDEDPTHACSRRR